MKHQFLKSVLVLGSVLAFMNCSDEATSAPDNNNGGIQIQPSDPTLTSSAAATPNSVQASSTSEATAASSATAQSQLSSASVMPGTSSANVQSSNSNVKASSSSVAKANSSSAKVASSSAKTLQSSSSAQNQPSSSEQQQSTGKITVTGSLTQTVAKGSAISKITFSGVESEPQRNWKLHFLQANYDKNA